MAHQLVFSKGSIHACKLVIDLNPSDEHCIFSTLSYVKEQAASLGIMDPCITFDQPLWLKAVEINAAAEMNIVCRLGGLHTLMSYLGSIGTLMAGSGWSEALKMCFGPNVVIHMLGGKAIARALRGHFLVDIVLNLKLMRHVLPFDKTSIASTFTTEIDAEKDVANSTCARLSHNDIKEMQLLITRICDDPNAVNQEEIEFGSCLNWNEP